MKKGLIFCVMALTLASKPALADQGEPMVFEPSGAWVMDDQEEVCTLRRPFVAGDASLILQFSSRDLGNYVDVILASSNLRTDEAKVTYQFLPDAEPRDPRNPRVGSLGEELRGVRFAGTMREPAGDAQSKATTWSIVERQQREATISGLQVDGVFEKPVLLRTGAMDAAMDAMRSCVDDLYVSWGFNPRIADATAVPASRLNSYDLARRANNAYPRKFARSGISARVNVLVSVGSDGRPTNCHARNPQPYPEFEKVVCETIMKHARYEPARDADGNAVEGVDTFEMTFSPD